MHQAEFAFDEDGQAIDPGELRVAVEKRRLERFGKLEEAHARRIEGARDDELLPVSIWAHLDAPPELPGKSADGPTRERPEAERALDAQVKKATTKLVRHLGRVDIKEARPFGSAPMVEAEVSVAQLRELARSEAVGAVFLREEEAIEDVGNSISITRSTGPTRWDSTGPG